VKLPRDISGDRLISRLKTLGFEPTRQTGSHIRLTRFANGQQMHVTVPRHGSLKVGTLNSIIREVCTQLGKEKEALIKELFGPG